MVLDGCFFTFFISKQVPKLTAGRIFLGLFARLIFFSIFFLIIFLEFFVFMFLMLTLQLEN